MALAAVFGLYLIGLTWRYVQKTSVPFDSAFYARIDSATGENALMSVPRGMVVRTDTVPKPKKAADNDQRTPDSLDGGQGSINSDRAPGSAKLRSGKGSAGSVQQMKTGRLNVNQATVRQLTLLPGIGPSLAGRIVEYRETSGPFRSPSDLVKVKGIGPKKLAKFEGMIVVE